MRKRHQRIYARPRSYPREVEARKVAYGVLDAADTPMMSTLGEERAYQYAGEHADRKGEATQVLCLETVRYRGLPQGYERELWRERVEPWVEVRLGYSGRDRPSALAERGAA